MKSTFTAALALASVAALGCSKSAHSAPKAEPGAANAEPGAIDQAARRAGEAAEKPITIDGSSTVFPINEAMAEEFQKKRGNRVTVAASGTGGGFKKLCAKELAIAGASRPIKPSEVEACRGSGVDYIELPVAFDGIAVVVNMQNGWVDKLTVAELKKLWEPAAQGKVKTWADVRKGWPKEEIHLFGAGVDSGTYDYFTKAIVGEEHMSRGDYTSSEDDNVLVKGIATDKLALGFFGFAYYEENKDKLKIVPIDDERPENGAGAIAPSHASIAQGTYQPLSRPVFIYVSKEAAARKEVQAFVDYYLGEGLTLVEEVGYVKLPDDAYALARKRFAERTPGSLFAGAGAKVGVTVTDLLAGK